MSKDADLLIDRMHLKAQANRWRILGIVAIVLALVIVSESQFGDGATALERDFIARITIDNFVTDDDEKIEHIQEVRDNPKAKALIVWIDTPGGSVVGGEEIYHQLIDLGKEKPVVAVMRSMATSAGYMIAIGADHIIAREGTLTGSIGVIMESAEFTDMAQKLGITPITIKSTPLKGSPGLLEEVTPEAREALNIVVEDIYAMFVRMVSERRKLTMQQALNISDGRVYTGGQALKLKLIDQLGGMEEAIDWLAEKKQINAELDVKDVDEDPQNMELIERLTRTVARKIFGSQSSTLDGALSIWQPNLQLQ